MASASTKAVGAKSTLTPSITLRGHGDWISSICYFPDGQRMISGSEDMTARQWDLKAGKEIEEARGVREEGVYTVAVSRDGRWVVTGGGRGELKACEVETGITKTLEGHSMWVGCVDISADNMLLASGSWDETVRIWNLGTGKLVAGPFKSEGWIGAVRFSTDSKKLAVKLHLGKRLEIWDVRSQKLDALEVGKYTGLPSFMHSPVIWTNNNKTIITAFNLTNDCDKTIYEFDALTLETVGTPFEGHTNSITGLALSFDGALLASASFDHTIKLWAFESRQLLASFDIQIPLGLIFSPDACQLAYTALIKNDHNICICDTPPDVLSQSRIMTCKKSTLNHLLHSDATRRLPVGHRKPPIFATPIVQRPPPTRDQQQSSFLRLGNFIRFSPRTTASRSGRTDQPRDPLDFPATSPLPPNRPRANSPPSTPLPGGRAFFNPIRVSSHKGKQKAREPKRKPVKVVNVPHGQVTYGDAVGVDDGTRPYVLFFCLSWFQKKEKEEPRPIYDDELDDDEEEENVPDPVAVPPRVKHEEIELKTLTGQSQPEAGPSRLAVTNRSKARSSSI